MPATPAALDQGRVQAGEMVFPPLARALATNKYKLIPVFNSIAPAFLFSVWFTTKDYAAKHPDVVKTFAYGGQAVDAAPISRGSRSTRSSTCPGSPTAPP